MSEFTNPFSTVVPDRKLTDAELSRAIRLNIAAELEAVHLYEAHAEATDNEFARRVLIDVANEEREHIGEFQKLLSYLAPDEQELLNHGAEEVEEMFEELKGKQPQHDQKGNSSPEIPTIGDIRN